MISKSQAGGLAFVDGNRLATDALNTQSTTVVAGLISGESFNAG